MAREMTPQERAAALYRALGDGCDLSAPEQEKRDIEAITDAYAALLRERQRMAASICPECGGAGVTDSGGFSQSDQPIMIPCGCRDERRRG